MHLQELPFPSLGLLNIVSNLHEHAEQRNVDVVIKEQKDTPETEINQTRK